MKKYLVVLLSVLFVLSTFSFVMADDGGMDSVRAMKPGAKVMLGGDMRVRGTWLKNADFENEDTDLDGEDDNRYYDQRFRLKIKGEAGNGISANVRLYIANSVKWNGAANACTGCIVVDYAYVTIPVSSVTVNAGLIKKYYGLAFMNGDSSIPQSDQYDSRYESIEVVGTFDTVTVKAFTNKQVDTFDTVNTDDNLKDFNDYGVVLTADLGDIEAGSMLIYHNDSRAELGDCGDATTSRVGCDGMDISVYAKGKVAGIGVGAELVFLTGDINKTPLDKTPLGFMLYAETTVGAIGVRADAAMVTNGYTASYSYEPILLIGTTQQTALADLSSEDDAKTFLISASVNTDVMEDVNVLGRIAYISAENEAGEGDKNSILELDGEVMVQIAKNARYIIEAAYGNPSDELGEEAVIVLANRAELYF